MQNNRPPIDLTVRIQTPENIEFEYRLAGPFRRVPAFLLDFVFRMLIIFGCWIAFLFVGQLISGIGSFGITFDLGVFLLFVFQFLLQWFYGAFFEAYWNGQTPGKWLCGIRVISVDGRPINLSQGIVRNLVRFADLAPTGIIGIVCVSLTERFQRLGDLAAGTMVVLNEVSWVPTNIRFEDARVMSLAEYIPPGFRMSQTLAKALALYAERRSRIPMARRQELASYIARPLLRKFGFREDTSADLLLCAIYYREFIVKEAFGKDSGQRRTPASLPNSSPSQNSSPLVSSGPLISSTPSQEDRTPPIVPSGHQPEAQNGVLL